MGWSITAKEPTVVPLGAFVIIGFWLLEAQFNGVQIQYLKISRKLMDFVNDNAPPRPDLSEPVTLSSRRIIREDRDETLYRTYLYWTLSPEWAMAGEFSIDLYDSDHGVASNFPTEVETRSAPLSVRYFSPLGFFGVLTGTFVDQHVHRPEGPGGNDTFTLLMRP